MFQVQVYNLDSWYQKDLAILGFMKLPFSQLRHNLLKSIEVLLWLNALSNVN